MSNAKFYICKHCGNLFLVMNDGGVVPTCCGEKMTVLEAGTTDAAQEKHVPVVTRNGNHLSVQVGSVLHPMEEKHYIEAIIVVQKKKTQIHYLKPGDEPKAEFELTCECPAEVYAYCNLHGLWKAAE